MLEEVEDEAEEVALHDSCGGIGYCPKYSHFVVNKTRWDKCHTTNHLDCDYRKLLKKYGIIF